MPFPAVFFDRDGTINYDPGYLGNPDLVELYPGVPEGISELKKAGFKIVVISNQSGIARGLISVDDVNEVNNRINRLLQIKNTSIDAFYFCPFHPEFSSSEDCECRKPSPKMVFDAAKDLEIDLSNSYLAGNSADDVECGLNSGLKTILIKSTITEDKISYLHNEGKIPTFVAENFSEACNYIIQDFLGDN
ncbi:MAG: HAD family hydrolase [Ignavibacteriales bacterium]|nr:MAG: HAD family hydrolase [Ignavibacteriales bacterium]